MRKNTFILICLSLLTLSCISCGGKDPEIQPDEKTPSAPTGLVLRSSTENSLTFQWDEVSGKSGYNWQLTKDGVTVNEGKVNSRHTSVSGLSKGTSYRFGVQAFNAAGASGWTYLDAETDGEVTPPTPPSSAPEYAEFLIPEVEEDGVARAFPGAQGGGMYTTGGRGGKVLHVTKLTDDGSEGTLRWAVEQTGPRTVVFDVAGVIPLTKALKIETDANHDRDNITIAGQTAPGDGICLKNYNFRISANNVIIRFLRFRMGDETKTAEDALQLYTGENNLHDVIIDHCSLSWSTDECGSFYGMTNFSLQWCILSESLLNSVHGKGRHGYGGIWGGSNSTFHHNLLAHHFSRNPRLDHDYVSTLKGPLNFVNNVIYNWGDNSSYGGESRPGSDFKKYNIVNNYYKPGPATTADKVRFLDPTTKCTYCDSSHPDQVVPGHFYMTGNFMHGNEGYSADNWSGKATTASAELIATIKADSFFTYEKASYLSLHSAENAFTSVVGYAGASLKRDSVDERVVSETKNGTFTYKGSNGGDKGLIDSQADVGGWPEYKGDTRSDFPAWVGDPNAYTLDPKKRYTNLEMYLHYLVREIVAKQNANAPYTNQL